jgi:TPP-dependent 2-oxoacid decarboxylase
MEKTTVGRYLITRLEQLGLGHMFGVPGDYVLDFMDRVIESQIQLVGNCNELNAGYAADAYARLNGIGAICVTYSVGGLSAINSAAGAWAERVPVVYISGAPTSAQRRAHAHMHHMSTSYDMQLEMYRKITVDAVQLTSSRSAPEEIDRVLSNCIAEKLPVYIEIPVDMVDAPCRVPGPLDYHSERTSDPAALAECVQETVALINAAEHPVILVGVEIHRFDLSASLLGLVEHIEIPYATTIDGKSALPELHPQFVGVYLGGLSRDAVREQLERSDGMLVFGAMSTDINTGGFTARLPQGHVVKANGERVQIGNHFYERVWIGDYIKALTDALQPRTYQSSHPRNPHQAVGDFQSVPDRPLRVPRFYDRLNQFLTDDMVVLAETGDAMFAASELYIQASENFISQAYYLSIGYCLPASLGVALARPQKRVVLLQGDGSFQMTAQELSTLLRQGCNPIIFLLNNDGYVIERLIHDGPYNNIQRWNYHQLPQAFAGDAVSLEVHTEGDLEAALAATQEHPDKLVFVNVFLPPNEGSSALERLCSKLRELQVGDSESK